MHLTIEAGPGDNYFTVACVCGRAMFGFQHQAASRVW